MTALNITPEVIQALLTSGILFFLDKNITIGLLASKTSKYLRKCLEKFSLAFEQKFNKALVVAEDYVEASRFNSASQLVEFYFPHIPSEFNHYK